LVSKVVEAVYRPIASRTADVTKKLWSLRLVELFQDFAAAGKQICAGYEAAAAVNACTDDSEFHKTLTRITSTLREDLCKFIKISR